MLVVLSMFRQCECASFFARLLCPALPCGLSLLCTRVFPPCCSWFQDKSDLQLYEMLPFLDIIADCHNVVPTIAREKSLCKYTFFGPTLTPPKIVLPWEAQQQQQQQQQQSSGVQMREIQVSVS